MKEPYYDIDERLAALLAYWDLSIEGTKLKSLEDGDDAKFYGGRWTALHQARQDLEAFMRGEDLRQMMKQKGAA